MSARALGVLFLVWLVGVAYGQLYFPGSDVLSGDLKDLDTESDALQWSYPGVDEPFQFKTSAVSHLVLNHEESAAKRPGNYRITLTQGDVVQGDIVDIDDTAITVDAGFAEPFVLAKTAIHRIDRDWDRSACLFGPKRA